MNIYKDKLQGIYRETKNKSAYLEVGEDLNDYDFGKTFNIFKSKSLHRSYSIDTWLYTFSKYQTLKILTEKVFPLSVSIQNFFSEAEDLMFQNTDFFNTKFLKNIMAIRNKYKRLRVAEPLSFFSRNSDNEAKSFHIFDQLHPLEDIEHILTQLLDIQRINPKRMREINTLKRKVCVYLGITKKLTHRQISRVLGLSIHSIKYVLSQYRSREINQHHELQVSANIIQKENCQNIIALTVRRMIARNERITVEEVRKHMLEENPNSAWSYSTVQRAFKDKLNGKFKLIQRLTKRKTATRQR